MAGLRIDIAGGSWVESSPASQTDVFSLNNGGFLPVKFTLALSLVAFTCLATTTQADFIIGSQARSAAMGGAGLAMVTQPVNGQQINPAALAYSDVPYAITWPGAGVRFKGVSFNEARKLTDNVVRLNSGDVSRIARTLSDGPARVDFHSAGGVTLMNQNIGYEAQGRAHADPDAQLRAWASNSANPLTGATSDVTAASVVTLPALAFAGSPAYEDGKLSVGARLRFQKVTGRVQRVTFTSEAGDTTVADIETQNKRGVAADLGAIYEPYDQNGVTFAVVANNLFAPSTKTFPQKLMLSGGAALILPGELFSMAADLVNVTNSDGSGIDLRIGLEVKPVPNIAVRGGWSAQNGFATGASYGGFGVAYGSRLPLIVTQSLRF